MAIGIVGNYGNNNQGDEAILEGIIVQLKKVHNIDREEIIVFSNQPEQTKEKYNVQSVKLYYKNKSAPMTLIKTMIRNKSIIKDLDMLLIGGGGIFMDLYGREAFIFGMYGWLAKLSGTPVILYGVGAGPILTRIGKVILRSLAHLSELVTVRDPKSKELLQAIGVKSPIHVIGDPAFQVSPPAEMVRKKGEFNIGVTAVPFYHISYWPNEDKEKYQNYIQGMAKNLDSLLQKYPNAQVNFFATKHPQDIMVTKEIRSLMMYKGRSTVCDENLNHNEIVKFAGEQDIVIGTRLHSLILALITSKPIIAVSYHHKVMDFMDMIECGDLTVPIQDLNNSPDFFNDMYSNMEKNWSETSKRFDDISFKMKQMSLSGMELVKRTMDNMPKEKVLVLSNMYPSKHSRTFGLFVKNQVDLLKNQGLHVDVIAIDDPRKKKPILLKKYGIFLFHGIWNLVIHGRKYKAVHAHYIFPTGLIGILYKKVLGKKLIVTAHGGDIDQMSKKSKMVQKQTKKILEESDHIIAVGEVLKHEIHTNFQIPTQKIHLINMGVNRNIFRVQNKLSLRSRLGIAESELAILFVGNLIKAKGLDDLVEAYKMMLTKEDRKMSLHLIGEPKDLNYFEEFQQRIKGIDSIIIHDAMDQKSIANWMGAADLFVLPSHIEGFGLVALEAMSCGLPVLGSDVGGLSYLLANDNGIKTEPSNPADIAEKALAILMDKEKQGILIENGLKKADEYDQEKLITSVMALYES